MFHISVCIPPPNHPTRRSPPFFPPRWSCFHHGRAAHQPRSAAVSESAKWWPRDVPCTSLASDDERETTVSRVSVVVTLDPATTPRRREGRGGWEERQARRRERGRGEVSPRPWRGKKPSSAPTVALGWERERSVEGDDLSGSLSRRALPSAGTHTDAAARGRHLRRL